MRQTAVSTVAARPGRRSNSGGSPGSPVSPAQRRKTHGLRIPCQFSADMNKNTAWIDYPGVWTSYILIILLSFFLFGSLGCDTGTSWTGTHLLHFVVTYYCFHWTKGSPFAEDQGLHDKETWWEQLEGGVQNTRNRKFFMLMPVFTFLAASHSTGWSNPQLALNSFALAVLLIAKSPNMHKVRIFGINSGYPT